jgi:hypothetical protein
MPRAGQAEPLAPGQPQCWVRPPRRSPCRPATPRARRTAGIAPLHGLARPARPCVPAMAHRPNPKDRAQRVKPCPARPPLARPLPALRVTGDGGLAPASPAIRHRRHTPATARTLRAALSPRARPSDTVRPPPTRQTGTARPAPLPPRPPARHTPAIAPAPNWHGPHPAPSGATRSARRAGAALASPSEMVPGQPNSRPL